MKILMVSMNSIHFQRWTDQLKDSGHEVFWFNIRDGGYSEKLHWVKQITGWKLKFPKLKGRVFVKKRLPWLYNKLSFLYENNTAKTFEKVLLEVKPDVVHSFVLYVSCAPILKVMNVYADIKWIYSSWGSDLFYFQQNPEYLKDIKRVLPRVNYLFTDCNRDVELAKKYGFNGKVLGVFPGGGGYSIDTFEAYIQPLENRNAILVKGYQGRSGRAIPVLKALEALSEIINDFQIIVLGADDEVCTFVKQSSLIKSNLKIYKKSDMLPHIEVIKLMGQALIYIGNSNSDGMPNTLLEAIIMGAFPIQSNPGGATEDIIKHKKNGLLIQDCENVDSIFKLIELAISNQSLQSKVFKTNQEDVKFTLDRNIIKKEVISKYNSIKI
ncbi:glycosyltransferase [uncultured Algibacter sp.]|uniref:glycosyltransferase n=1 Tax=uncultured Algibacter sp. TaxID=298659 RepID=UPI002603C09E|nr:glycosyltransferase [uncultured Algibacter sp.]